MKASVSGSWKEYDRMELVDALFDRLSQSIMKMTLQLSDKYQHQEFYLCGRCLLQSIYEKLSGGEFVQRSEYCIRKTTDVIR